MKNIHLFTQITLIGIISTNLLASSVLAENSPTTTTDTNKPTESGKVKPKDKCGNRGGLLTSYCLAEEQLATLPENMSLSIPLGTNSPVSTGSLFNDNSNDPRLSSNLLAIGIVNSSGQAEPITPRDLIGMFSQGRQGGGTLGNPNSNQIREKTNNKKDNFLVNDKNKKLSRRIPVCDLIVLNKRNRKTYLVQNVVADSFCRDALNAVLTRTYRPHNINLTRLRRVDK
jgi:hypothetical protein